MSRITLTEYTVMMTKEGDSKIVNFITLEARIPVS